MTIHLALVKRAENLELPLQGLRAISELRNDLEDLQRAHILAARDKGASWAEIAEALGISRQALQQKMRGASSRTLRVDAIQLDPASENSEVQANKPHPR